MCVYDCEGGERDIWTLRITKHTSRIMRIEEGLYSSLESIPIHANA